MRGENLELFDLTDDIDLEKWKCATDPDTFTAHTLVQKINEGSNNIHGGIILDPIYQREYKFTIKKESSIIESLILEIPIPVIYLSKNLESDVLLFNVIDGMHRLNSIYRFFNNEYALRDLKILKSLEGKKFAQLPPKIRNKLEFSTKIRVDSIDISNNPGLEYEVFLRFNQETNPLTKQELNEVMYRSEFSFWFKDYVQHLLTDSRWYQLFNVNEKKIRDKTINYNLYVTLAYNQFGLISGKNDTPYLVAHFMKNMKDIDGDELERKKEEVKDYLELFIEFSQNLSEASGIPNIFSKQFIDGKKPRGNHNFLISYLIQMILAHKYLLNSTDFNQEKDDVDYFSIYQSISQGMEDAGFYDFGGVSSTSYAFQSNCYQHVSNELDKLSF
ncbi:DUF262 domain-containing protein [Halobacillus mangrovi]|uniref:DUF262 domain-containing protein n=1 Tax=Halobacillus mangrovi TaxID=402384 RepID=UPI003D97421C